MKKCVRLFTDNVTADAKECIFLYFFRIRIFQCIYRKLFQISVKNNKFVSNQITVFNFVISHKSKTIRLVDGTVGVLYGLAVRSLPIFVKKHSFALKKKPKIF